MACSAWQCVDDHGHTDPRGFGIDDDVTYCRCVRAGFDPIINQQNAVPWLQQIWTKGQSDRPVEVVRWRSTPNQPLACDVGMNVLAYLSEPDSESERGQRTDDKTSRLDTDHDGRGFVTVEVGKGRTEFAKNSGVRPPSGRIRHLIDRSKRCTKTLGDRR